MLEKSWFKLYATPRNLVHEIEANPRVGFWVISSIYGIASSFFFAHFYSFGFFHSFAFLFFLTSLIGPVLGAFFITLDAWLLHKISFLFGNAASLPRALAILAASKVFYLITLASWLLFFAIDSTTSFLYVSSEASSLCVSLISSSVYFLSFFLLVQILRKSLSLTFAYAFIQTIILSVLSFSITCLSMFIVRFIYISMVSFF